MTRNLDGSASVLLGRTLVFGLVMNGLAGWVAGRLLCFSNGTGPELPGLPAGGTIFFRGLARGAVAEVVPSNTPAGEDAVFLS